MKQTIRCVQQKLCRRQKNFTMSELIRTFCDKRFVTEDVTSFLDRNFSGVKLDLKKTKLKFLLSVPKTADIQIWLNILH